MSRARSAQTPPRVVLDTNLVLSALVFTGGTLVTLRRPHPPAATRSTCRFSNWRLLAGQISW